MKILRPSFSTLTCEKIYRYVIILEHLMHPLIINPVMIVLEETQPNADAAAQNAKFSLNF